MTHGSILKCSTNFLRNRKHSEYIVTVEGVLNNFHARECNMSLKIHIFHSHIDFFPANLDNVRKEPGERFHK